MQPLGPAEPCVIPSVNRVLSSRKENVTPRPAELNPAVTGKTDLYKPDNLIGQSPEGVSTCIYLFEPIAHRPQSWLLNALLTGYQNGPILLPNFDPQRRKVDSPLDRSSTSEWSLFSS